MRHLVVSSLLVALSAVPAAAQESEPSGTPFAVEYYYKIRWGHFDEWMDLYKRNHWPIIEAGLEQGAMLSADVERPFHHVAEEDRWDLRVTIVYADIAIAHAQGLGRTDQEMRAFLSQLFPDMETFASEEQRRFELLEEHTDVPVYSVDTGSW